MKAKATASAQTLDGAKIREVETTELARVEGGLMKVPGANYSPGIVYGYPYGLIVDGVALN
jgi:hypothetical protein